MTLKHVRKSKLAIIVVVAVTLYLLVLFIFYLDMDPHSSDLETSTSSRSGNNNNSGTTKSESKRSIFSFLFQRKKKRSKNNDMITSSKSSSISQNVKSSSIFNDQNHVLTVQDRSSTISAFNRLWNETINGPWSHWSAIGFCRNHSSLLEFVPHSICHRPSCFYSPILRRPIDIDKLRNVPPLSLSSSLSKATAPWNSKQDLANMEQYIEDITWNGDQTTCHQPTGGQVSPSEAHTLHYAKKSNSKKTPSSSDGIETTFVISLNSSDSHNELGVDAILEVFRTASEVNSAEYLVVYDSADSQDQIQDQIGGKSWGLDFLRRQKNPIKPNPISTQGNREALNLLHNLKELFGISLIQLPMDVKDSEDTSWTATQHALSMAKKHALGKYIALVRHDVLVLPGWLTMLRRTLQSSSHGQVGMVGPLFLNQFGIVLEAGGVIFRDGNVHHIGFSFQPRELPMQHTRAVDFINTACLLMPRDVVQKLPSMEYFSPMLSNHHRKAGMKPQGLFDAYLSMFIIEELQLKVIFQPFGAIIHASTNSYRPVILELNQPSQDKKKKSRGSKLNTVQEKQRKEEEEKHYQFLLNLHQRLNAYCPSPVNGVNSVDRVRAVVGLDNLDYLYTWRLESDMGTSFYREQNRILYLEDVVPEPDRDAGSIRLYELLHILSELGYSVTFEPQPIQGRNIRYVLPLLADGVNMVLPGTLHDMAKSVEQPRSVALSMLSETSICPWKALIIARRDVFLRHYDDVQRICPNIPIIFDTVDVHFIRELRMFSLKYNNSDLSFMSLIESNHDAQREMSEALSNQQKELNAMRKSKITIVVSSEEKRILQKIFSTNKDSSTAPVDVRIISNIYQVDDAEDSVGPEHRNGAIFAGNMCHTPNMDAVDFIVREVLKSPEVFPAGFKMHFVWSRSIMCPNPILENALKHPLVEVHRDISNEELFELHQKVMTVLAPLRYGAGVKGKVNYGLLHGVPVIATKVASEGMGLIDGVNFLRAETGEEFVQSILQLYQDTQLFTKLVEGGKTVMKTVFGRDVANDRIQKAIIDIGASVTDSRQNGRCPFVGLYDSHKVLNWNNYWHHDESNDQCEHNPFFPLYPRVPYLNLAYLNHVS